MNPLRSTLVVGATALAAAACLVVAPAAQAQDTKPRAGAADPVARGKYLVSTSGCHDCHTPFKPTADGKGAEPDMTRALSGHPESLAMPPAPKLTEPWLVAVAATNTAWSGPWGVSFTANLTPDPETGLGKWTRKNFIDTIRTGRHMGRGRAILPPMPIPVYSQMTDADLSAIYAYLRTIPAIRNKVPEPMAPRSPGQ